MSMAAPPLSDVAAQALNLARRAGATAAVVQLGESESLIAAVCAGVPTERTFRRSTTIQLTLLRGRRQAAVSSSDLSADAIATLVQRGLAIADLAAEDPCVGLPAADERAQGHADLDLDHPWSLGMADAIAIARRAEDAALAVGDAVTLTEGSQVQTHRSHHCLATSDGFLRTWVTTGHRIGCSPVARRGTEKQIDHWWDWARRPADLMSPEAVGQRAAAQAAARLGARRIPTQTCPVLFAPPAALGVLADFSQALSAKPLYTQASYLAGALGRPCLAPHVHLVDDPLLPRGAGSASHDDWGVALRRRAVVEAGVLRGCFLGLYGARRLGLPVADHGQGPTNLVVRSDRTVPGDDFAAMLRRLGTGLVVSGMTGKGTNLMTGDFSRAVHGFWVDGGEIRYPVAGITIAGQLGTMLTGLQAVGSDILTRPGASTGSWLVDAMRVGGA